MAKERNRPIGEVACPFKGCTERAPVYRYRERSGDDKRRRFAGLLYSVCSRKHRCEDQEFLLTEATIWGAEKSESAAPSAPEKTPEKPAPAPVQKSTPAPAPAPAKPKGWGFFT